MMGSEGGIGIESKPRAKSAFVSNTIADRVTIEPNRSNTNFTVTVRIRPLTATEELQSPNPTISVFDEQVLIFDPSQARANRYRKGIADHHKRTKETRYAFDRVFGMNSTQTEVFEHTTKPLIDGVLDGINSTCFAYGATGAGKTHTMAGIPTDPGIMVLTMCELFNRIHELKDEKIIKVKVTYLEIYNETIRDLLVDNSPALDLREDNKGITIAGLSEHEPTDVHHIMTLLKQGNANRMMSPTMANATSSRSHAVLQIHITQQPRTANINQDVQYAILSLIDLAGSERASVTQNKGERIREGANINRSLLSLGNCINALCASKKPQHVPYRDSKLTRLLKFSLGGNCKTVMIAAVSPHITHYEDTYNTLVYANRAKNIKTTVEKNTLNVSYHIRQYVQIISELRLEIEELKLKNAVTDHMDLPSSAFVPSVKSKMEFENISKEFDVISKEALLFESQQCMLTEEILLHEINIDYLKFLLDIYTSLPGQDVDLSMTIQQLESAMNILQENLELLQFDLTVLFDEIDKQEGTFLELRNSIRHKELDEQHIKLLEQIYTIHTLTISKTRHEGFSQLLQKNLDFQRTLSTLLMTLMVEKKAAEDQVLKTLSDMPVILIKKDSLDEFTNQFIQSEKLKSAIERKTTMTIGRTSMGQSRLSMVESRSQNRRVSSAYDRRLSTRLDQYKNDLKPNIETINEEQKHHVLVASPNPVRLITEIREVTTPDALHTWKSADPREMLKVVSPSMSRSLNNTPSLKERNVKRNSLLPSDKSRSLPLNDSVNNPFDESKIEKFNISELSLLSAPSSLSAPSLNLIKKDEQGASQLFASPVKKSKSSIVLKREKTEKRRSASWSDKIKQIFTPSKRKSSKSSLTEERKEQDKIVSDSHSENSAVFTSPRLIEDEIKNIENSTAQAFLDDDVTPTKDNPFARKDSFKDENFKPLELSPLKVPQDLPDETSKIEPSNSRGRRFSMIPMRSRDSSLSRNSDANKNISRERRKSSVAATNKEVKHPVVATLKNEKTKETNRTSIFNNVDSPNKVKSPWKKLVKPFISVRSPPRAKSIFKNKQAPVEKTLTRNPSSSLRYLEKLSASDDNEGLLIAISKNEEIKHF
jgi:hypothetical protein